MHYASDPRHAELLLRELDISIDGKSTVTTPGTKIEEDENDPKLDPGKASRYRSTVARATFLYQDGGDIQCCTKERSRFMASPAEKAWSARIRLAPYLKNSPRYVQIFRWQNPTSTVNTLVDADWAGKVSTRKGTSRCVLCWGSHAPKQWSATQNVVALSRGESEFYATVKGVSNSLGMKALVEDLGGKALIRALTDATTGKSLASRKGLGNVRHTEVAELWIQQAVREGKHPT